MAILYPNRLELARAFKTLLDAKTEFEGASDHAGEEVADDLRESHDDERVRGHQPAPVLIGDELLEHGVGECAVDGGGGPCPPRPRARWPGPGPPA